MSDLNVIKLADIDDCTGCALCVNVCPKDAIIMSSENKLFSFPYIDRTKCITCGRCMSVCPIINPIVKNEFPQKYYASWNKNEDEQIKSTSGGMGTAIAKKAIELGYVVIGAAFDDQWNLFHLKADNKMDIEKFRGSKYLQSDVTQSYYAIKQSILDNKKILFIGTPCQVEAIKHYVLNKDQGKLLTCEIICHGVNSSKVWQDWVNYLQRKYKSKLVEYNFRSKSHGWQRRKGGPNLRVSYAFENGKKVDEPAWKNQFHYWFGHHYMLRYSCLHCKFRNIQRRADITIGDFWGVEKVISNIDTNKGVSVTIISSEKGEDFINQIDDINLQEVNAKDANQVLRGFVDNKTNLQIDVELNRAHKFEKEYINSGFDEMYKKYHHLSTIGMFIYKIRAKLGL